MQQSDSELSDTSFEVENNLALEAEMVQDNVMDETLEQSVRNHVLAAAILAGTFALPCFIAAKLLK